MIANIEKIMAHREDLKKRNEPAPQAAPVVPTTPEVPVIRRPHLVLDLWQVKGHAQDHMESLGITYQLAVPQSMSDSWWFFNCENMPDPLPESLKFLKATPQQCVGRGLSQQNAQEIEARCKLPLKPVNLDVYISLSENIKDE